MSGESLAVIEGYVRRRPVEGLRLRLLQFTGRSDEGSNGDERPHLGLKAAVRGIGSAQGRAQGTSQPAVHAACVRNTHAGRLNVVSLNL